LNLRPELRRHWINQGRPHSPKREQREDADLSGDAAHFANRALVEGLAQLRRVKEQQT